LGKNTFWIIFFQNLDFLAKIMTSPTKNLKPKTFKKIFQVQTRSLATFFDGLNSSLSQSANNLWSC